MDSVSLVAKLVATYLTQPLYSGARIDELVSAIESPSAWNALLTRRDRSDDTEDDEVVALRMLEKNLLAYCGKSLKRSIADG